MSFHGILVADELICHNFCTNDAILMIVGRFHLWVVPHPYKDEFCQVSLKSHHLFKSYDNSAHQPQECHEMTQIVQRN